MTNIDKILLIVANSLRYDCIRYLSDMKYLERDDVSKFLETPTLDRLAKQSVCFTRCYTTSANAPAAHASIFTGTKNIIHKIRSPTTSNTKQFLSEKIFSIAEILKQQNFHTILLSEAITTLSTPKLTRGFDHLFNNETQLYNFLNKHKDEKIFLFCLFEDNHAPYLFSGMPPFEGYNDDFFDTMKSIYSKYSKPMPTHHDQIWEFLYKQVDNSRKLWFPLYVKGVSKFDKGKLANFLESIDNNGFNKDSALFIFTSDHGEGKAQPGKDHFEHIGEAYDETTRVPLLVKIPNKKPAIIDDVVSNIDIFNIIIEEGLGKNPQDLVNYKIHGINPFKEKRDYAWFEYYLPIGNDGIKSILQSRTIITKDKKYILRGNPEVYLDDNVFDIDDIDFMRNLYYNLFLRIPKDEVISNYIPKLTKSSFAKKLVKNITNVTASDSADKFTKKIRQGKITQKSLYESFINSEEYDLKKIFSIIDLRKDPFEENEINPSSRPEYFVDYLNHLDELFQIQQKN